MFGQQRLDAIEILLGVSRVGFEPDLIGLRGSDRVLERPDVSSSVN